MKTYLILLIALIATPVHSADAWSTNDVLREGAFLGALAIDWAQTKTIVEQPMHYGELNPVMGKHPSLGRLNTVFGLTAVGHIGVSNWLSVDSRRIWQNSTLTLEGVNIARNRWLIGLKMTW